MGDETKGQGIARAAIHGTMWMYASHYTGKVIVFLSTLVLARLLSQEAYGVAGYALVFIALLEVVGDLGVGSALVFFRDDDEALSTGFWLALATGIVLFAVSWLAAPWVGAFYRDERAIGVTRLLAVVFPISALGAVHSALLYRKLAFGKRFLPNLMINIGKAVVSVVLGCLGFGAWCLILGQVAGAALGTIGYWLTARWRPRFEFDFTKGRRLLSYGTKLIAVNSLSTLQSNVDYLFIGRFLGAAPLGVYTLAFRIPELLISQVCGVISTVAFPVYASLDGDVDRLQKGFLTTARYLSIVTLPVGVGLMLVARPAVVVLFGDKWSEAIPVVPAIAAMWVIVSLLYNAGDVYKAIGRPEILVYLTLVELALLLPGMWWAVAVQASIVTVGWVHVVVVSVGRLIDLGIASRLLRLSIGQIIGVFRPAAIGTLAMAMSVRSSLVGTQSLAPIVQLAAACIIGGVTYGVVLLLVERDVVETAWSTFRTALARRQ